MHNPSSTSASASTSTSPSGAPDNLIKNPLDKGARERDTPRDRPGTNQAHDPGPDLITNPLDKPGASDNLIQNPLDKPGASDNLIRNPLDKR